MAHAFGPAVVRVVVAEDVDERGVEAVGQEGEVVATRSPQPTIR